MLLPQFSLPAVPHPGLLPNVDLHGSVRFRAGEERGVLGTRLEWTRGTDSPSGLSCGLGLSVLVGGGERGGEEWTELVFS